MNENPMGPIGRHLPSYGMLWGLMKLRIAYAFHVEGLDKDEIAARFDISHEVASYVVRDTARWLGVDHIILV